MAELCARSERGESHGGGPGGFGGGDEAGCSNHSAQARLRIGFACRDHRHRGYPGGEGTYAHAVEAESGFDSQVGDVGSQISYPREEEQMGVCSSASDSSSVLTTEGFGLDLTSSASNHPSAVDFALGDWGLGEEAGQQHTVWLMNLSCPVTENATPGTLPCAPVTALQNSTNAAPMCASLSAYHRHHNCVHGVKGFRGANGEVAGRGAPKEIVERDALTQTRPRLRSKISNQDPDDCYRGDIPDGTKSMYTSGADHSLGLRGERLADSEKEGKMGSILVAVAGQCSATGDSQPKQVAIAGGEMLLEEISTALAFVAGSGDSNPSPQNSGSFDAPALLVLEESGGFRFLQQ